MERVAGIFPGRVSVSRGQSAVRSAVSGDATALAALDCLVNTSGWTIDQFADACSAESQSAERALVVDFNGRPSGFVVYSRVLDEVCIHNIAVHPALQCSGFGQLLLAAMLAQARDGGAAYCYLEVRESNLPARRLYERLGFNRDGVRKNYYPTATGREDAVLMSRVLTGRAGVWNERA